MPIYEFYCEVCNAVYQFFSRSVNTDKVPNCPKCKDVKLKRTVSTFATISGTKEEGATEEGMLPIDEAKMERAVNMLARELGRVDEDNPRQTAMFMRKLFDVTGLSMGPGMEEALRRLEQGEDPDRVEEELGDLLEEEEPFTLEPKGKRARGKPKPRRDETIYDL